MLFSLKNCLFSAALRIRIRIRIMSLCTVPHDQDNLKRHLEYNASLNILISSVTSSISDFLKKKCYNQDKNQNDNNDENENNSNKENQTLTSMLYLYPGDSISIVVMNSEKKTLIVGKILMLIIELIK